MSSRDPASSWLALRTSQKPGMSIKGPTCGKDHHGCKLTCDPALRPLSQRRRCYCTSKCGSESVGSPEIDNQDAGARRLRQQPDQQRKILIAIYLTVRIYKHHLFQTELETMKHACAIIAVCPFCLNHTTILKWAQIRSKASILAVWAEQIPCNAVSLNLG